MRRRHIAVWLFKGSLLFLAIWKLRSISSGITESSPVNLPLFKDSALFQELSAAASETVRRVKTISYLQHHFLPHVHPERLQNALELQKFLTCAVERGEFRRVTGLDEEEGRVDYEWQPDLTCSQPGTIPGAEPSPMDAEEVCKHLRGKRLLMLGDRTQYSLHDLLLHRLSGRTDLKDACVGPEFCNWHTICPPPIQTTSNPSNKIDSDSDEESNANRAQAQSPVQKHLVPSNWSHLGIMRYAPSSSLLLTTKRGDRRLTGPYLSSATDIRETESFWKFWVSGSDIIILSKAPLPAPAWSWNELLDEQRMHKESAEWSGFAVRPVRDHEFSKVFQNQTVSSPLLLQAFDESAKVPSSVWEYEPPDIVQAALRATLQVWLPTTLKTLSALREIPGGPGTTAQKTIIWRGEWFQSEICHRSQKTQTRKSFAAPLLENALGLQHTGGKSRGVDNPWEAFYNVQGQLPSAGNGLRWMLIPPRRTSAVSVTLH